MAIWHGSKLYPSVMHCVDNYTVHCIQLSEEIVYMDGTLTMCPTSYHQEACSSPDNLMYMTVGFSVVICPTTWVFFPTSRPHQVSVVGCISLPNKLKFVKFTLDLHLLCIAQCAQVVCWNTFSKSKYTIKCCVVTSYLTDTHTHTHCWQCWLHA